MEIKIRTISGKEYTKNAINIENLMKDAKLRGHVITDNGTFIMNPSIESFNEVKDYRSTDPSQTTSSRRTQDCESISVGGGWYESSHTNHSFAESDAQGTCTSKAYSQSTEGIGRTESEGIGICISEGISMSKPISENGMSKIPKDKSETIFKF